MKQKRILTPYEKTQLFKHNLSEDKLLHTDAPVEYITNHVDFFDLDFYVSEDVLIPRIETEELTKKAISAAQKIYSLTKKPLCIADIGTGSGAIAIVVALKLDELNIPYELYATDVSSEALKIAKKNIKKLAPQSDIKLLTSNLLEAFLVNEKYSTQFDLLISNLPYIPSARIPKLDTSVVNYEPKLALDGGESGLELIHQLIRQAKHVSKNNTQILLEVDYTHRYTDFIEHKKDWDIFVDKKTDGVRFVSLIRKENV